MFLAGLVTGQFFVPENKSRFIWTIRVLDW